MENTTAAKTKLIGYGFQVGREIDLQIIEQIDKQILLIDRGGLKKSLNEFEQFILCFKDVLSINTYQKFDFVFQIP